MCHLSHELSSHGYHVTAMDPNIRLSDKEIKASGFNAVKEKFVCDYIAGQECGTDISQYDLIVGLEPCDATEHIIRQCVEYNKPCMIALCAAAHDGLDGTKFSTPHRWYRHLRDIEGCHIEHVGDHTLAICDSQDLAIRVDADPNPAQ